MEVQLSTAPSSIVADTFVSLRIGDVQKQSRLTSNRTYHFPATGDGRGRFGRIEVFRRVGELMVDLSKQDGSRQSVEVPCSIPGLTNLSMCLAVKGADIDAIKEAQSQKGPAKGKEKWDAAQRYLTKYNLEDVLAEAMRDVIRHKPEDPFTFLSEQILRRKPAETANIPGDVVPRIPMQQSSTPAPQQATSVLAPTPAPVPAPSPASLATAGPEAAFASRPSVGTWLQIRPVSAPPAHVQEVAVSQATKPAAATMLPFREYYSQNVAAYQMPDELLGKFRTAPRPPPPPPSPPAPAIPFAMRASVGSWLTARPNWKILKLSEESALKRAAEEKRAVEQKPFCIKPSVGTWLAPRPWQDPEPTLLGMTSNEMAKLPHDELIASLQSELERKDREIEELKATLLRAK